MSTPSPSIPLPLLSPAISHNVQINRETTLKVLYNYPPSTIIEYPETSEGGHIGHLFTLSPDRWENPVSSFVYSQGAPKGSMKNIELRLARDKASRKYLGTPMHDLFEKTLALWSAFQDLGCTGPLFEPTTYTSDENTRRKLWLLLLERVQRGHEPRATCDGHLLFQRSKVGKPYVRYDINESSYDIDYLEALFTEDTDEIKRVEDLANQFGFGPLAPCPTVANFSSNRVCCPCEHRLEDGSLSHAELDVLACCSKLCIFMPLPEYQERCPKVLVVCHREHSHLPPSPSKTPIFIQNEIIQLMQTLQFDLPDLTPRRLLCHPSVLSYIQQRLPDTLNPTISGLHSSLTNQDHLRVYISQAQAESLLHLKGIQDTTLLPHQRYIRYVTEHPVTTLTLDEEEEPENPGQNLRIVCDISFKRIVGFREFALGALDRDSRQSIVYCRAYTTHQSTVAHRLIFQTMERIVKADTRQHLRWRHIHGSHANDLTGILFFTGDQHGGQGKGLGTHLQDVAMSVPDRPDFHEPHRLLRNINTTPVPELVKNVMRSLDCLKHDDWDGAIQIVEAEGGKAGADWVRDKTRSGFAFPGMCWAKSHIPRIVWQVGDSNSNLIETLHADVNCEGISCTLVGGVKKGLEFDNLKVKTVKVFDKTGIWHSYNGGHLSKSVSKNLRRRARQRYNVLNRQDDKIHERNKKVLKACQTLTKAETWLPLTERNGHDALAKAERAVVWARDVFAKAVDASSSVVGMGSGRVGLVLPASQRNGFHAGQFRQ
ncbi:hypothetical protein JAAARDRAFT_54405 [Jaapia argillacea MUCL 33604]|uniref:Uncharacterized protein n=1 Tax=Jaapia argillacea MUCL 33604 TaxID=933084 RepID=A0A067Q8J7_9AGAM|nr:hypothetical protein JAAARDRAFT_54405 [Jaapia argillacea MUCL 33604]